MKGGMLSLYHVGQEVTFTTTHGVVKLEDRGRIVKLHQSCTSGLAEIRPSDGTRKVSRRLINVKKPK